MTTRLTSTGKPSTVRENHWLRRLDMSQASAVRELWRKGYTYPELSKLTGLCAKAVQNLVQNQTYYDPNYKPPSERAHALAKAYRAGQKRYTNRKDKQNASNS